MIIEFRGVNEAFLDRVIVAHILRVLNQTLFFFFRKARAEYVRGRALSLGRWKIEFEILFKVPLALTKKDLRIIRREMSCKGIEEIMTLLLMTEPLKLHHHDLREHALPA